MATTSTEIKDLVDQVENGFKSGTDPHQRVQLVRDIIFGRYNYTKELSPYLPQKIGVLPDLLRVYKDQMIAALRTDMRLHLEPVGTGQRKDTAADRVEVMEAHQLMRLCDDGIVLEDMAYYLTVGLYWAGWLEMERYVEPEQAKGESNKDFAERAKRERDGFFPWSLRTLNPETVAWVEEKRVPTTAVLHYRKPVIDLLCRYGRSYGVRREDSTHALKVFHDHFGFLRADLDRSAWTERSLYNEEIEVVACDDSSRISHYADLSVKLGDRPGTRAKSDKDRYAGLGETDYDNPFGQCSLLLAEGVYNPYEQPAYRREGLMMAAINIEHAKSRIKSHWASASASPPMFYRQQPSETDAQTDKEPAVLLPILDAEGRPTALDSYGEIKEVVREVDATIDKLYGVLSDETALAAMRSYLFDPDKSNKDTAASITLAQIDEAAKMLASAQASKSRALSRALDMVRYSQCHGQNAHRGRGEPRQRADQSYVFVTTGKETKVKGRYIKNGEPIEVTPQDLDQEYVRTLEPYDNSVTAVAARTELASTKWDRGAILWDDFLEECGVENITEFNRKKTEEQLYQVDASEMVSEQRLKVAQYTAVISGLSIEQVLMGLPEDVVPQIVAAGSPTGPLPQGPSVQRFGSPVQNQPAAMGSTSVG